MVLRNRNRKVFAAATFGALLVGCGQSMRHGEHKGRDAGDDGDAAPLPVTNCAYPVAGQVDVALMEKIARLSHPECRYTFGEARDLPFVSVVTSNGSYIRGEHAFSFDVNGDGVSDIFFWEPNRENQGFESLALAVSVASGGELTYVREDCDALATIPHGRVFVRDLNNDAKADLVVGGAGAWNGLALRAFLNLPTGFVEVLRLPQDGLYALIDVAVADLGGAAEDLNDIAFGYDLVLDFDSSEVEWGVAVTQLDAAPPSAAHRLHKWAYDGSSAEVDATGEFALGHDSAGAWLFVADAHLVDSGGQVSGSVVRRRGDDFSELAVELEAPPLLLANNPFVVDAWAVPFDDTRDALALLYESLGVYPSAVALYDLSDATPGFLPLLQEFSAVEMHRYNREFGGGQPLSFRWMIDANGDGNVDFLERGRRVDDSGLFGVRDYFSFHLGLDGGGFGDPWTIEVSQFMNFSAESPFVAVGTVPAAIVVNDPSYDESGIITRPATFQVLECAPE